MIEKLLLYILTTKCTSAFLWLQYDREPYIAVSISSTPLRAFNSRCNFSSAMTLPLISVKIDTSSGWLTHACVCRSIHKPIVDIATLECCGCAMFFAIIFSKGTKVSADLRCSAVFKPSLFDKSSMRATTTAIWPVLTAASSAFTYLHGHS